MSLTGHVERPARDEDGRNNWICASGNGRQRQEQRQQHSSSHGEYPQNRLRECK